MLIMEINEDDVDSIGKRDSMLMRKMMKMMNGLFLMQMIVNVMMMIMIRIMTT